MRKKQRSTKKNRRCTRTLQEFRGSAWAMPSAAAAKASYETALKRLLSRDPETWSLVSALFENKPVVVFVWAPTLLPSLVATVLRTIRAAGGVALDEEAEATLITQVLARRQGLRAKKPFETLIAHHPTGKPFWDLED